MINWQWKTFAQLNTEELYEILQVRQQVFAVEQNCIYQDADGLDQYSWHLSGWNGNDTIKNNLVAYCRVVYPSYKYSEPSIGRLLTVQKVRSSGMGKQLLATALDRIEKEYPEQAVRISAQLYLKEFYSLFGFQKVSEPYLEDSMPHIQMLKLSNPE